LKNVRKIKTLKTQKKLTKKIKNVKNVFISMNIVLSSLRVEPLALKLMAAL